MTKQKRAKQQWVKVCFRFADKQVRKEGAECEKTRTGKDINPDSFDMTVAYSVDHCGFLGAFEKAKEFIANDKLMHGDTFEYRIDGGEW